MTLGSRETRWLVVSEDGRHGTLGRHTDPTDEMIATVEDQLRQAALVGWLVVMKGDYYGRAKPELMMVRPLAGAIADDWNQAAERFETARINRS